MDDSSVDYCLTSNSPKALFLTDEKLFWIRMVKNYWEKRFKKELVEEEDKLKQEVNNAVRKKLDSLSDAEDDSNSDE